MHNWRFTFISTTHLSISTLYKVKANIFWFTGIRRRIRKTNVDGSKKDNKNNAFIFSHKIKLFFSDGKRQNFSVLENPSILRSNCWQIAGSRKLKVLLKTTSPKVELRCKLQSRKYIFKISGSVFRSLKFLTGSGAKSRLILI
jgi:hypothetical protein